MHKNYGDSFEATELESLLAEREVGRLIVTGAESDACIRSTLPARSPAATTSPWSATPTRPATRRSGEPRLPEAVITHTNLYWRYQSAPGRTAGTIDTAEVSFAPAS